MDQQEFNNMIQDTDYHFFVFSCPAIVPFHFALHTWVVLVYPDGKIIRWDLCHFKNKKNPSLGYLHENFLPAWKGISKYFWRNKEYYESNLLYHCSGNWDSLSYKIVSFMEDIDDQYPYKGAYRLVWHNSNYFTQWILHQFPEIKFELPRNAVGK